MPLQRRLPKLKGFRNPNRVEYSVVNVEQLSKVFGHGEVDPVAMYAHGLVHKGQRVKVLGRGDVSAAMVVRAHAFSETARAKLERAGGRAETIG